MAFSINSFFLFLLLLSCSKNEISVKDIPITEENLAGDWIKNAYYESQANDSLGILPPRIDLWETIPPCKRDEIMRLEHSENEQKGNKSFIGTGSIACENQQPNSFYSVGEGRWNIFQEKELSILVLHRSDYGEIYVILHLTTDSLKIRKSGQYFIQNPDGTYNRNQITYRIWEYKRLN